MGQERCRGAGSTRRRHYRVYKMRKRAYLELIGELDAFVQARFEVSNRVTGLGRQSRFRILTPETHAEYVCFLK